MSSFTSETFQWSGAVFLLGPNLIWLVHAMFSSWRLFQRSKRSSYYLAMFAIAILRIVDIALNCFVMNLEDENDAAFWFTIQGLVEWPASTGFTYLNAYRLHKVARNWSPRLTNASTALMWVNMITFNLSMGAYVYSTAARIPLDQANFWFAFASMYDAVLNAGISSVFLLYLRAEGLGAPPGPHPVSGQPRFPLLSVSCKNRHHGVGDAKDWKGGVRKGLHRLVQEDSILIPAECLAIIASNALQVVSRDLDPTWSTYYAAEAFRLYAFTKFLKTLNRIMLQGNSSTTLHQARLVSRRHHSDQCGQG